MINMSIKAFFMIIISTLFLNCARIPRGIEPVTGFELERYLGTWYEIARLDNRFERNLIHVKAEYTMQGNRIRVFNQGYDTLSKEHKSIVGKAYPVGKPGEGRLKVSFFGPFYGGYNIIALDKDNYFYALVCGNSRKYLWILAREPKLAEDILQKLIDKAKELGFDTGSLILVEQDI